MTSLILKLGKTENCSSHGCRVHQANPLWYKITVKHGIAAFHIFNCKLWPVQVLGWDHWEPTSSIQPLHSSVQSLCKFLSSQRTRLALVPCYQHLSGADSSCQPTITDGGAGPGPPQCLQHRHLHLTDCQAPLSCQWRLIYRRENVLLSSFSLRWAMLPLNWLCGKHN